MSRQPEGRDMPTFRGPYLKDATRRPPPASKAEMQLHADRAFLLILQGDWHGAYMELGQITSHPFTGEWRPPTTIEEARHG